MLSDDTDPTKVGVFFYFPICITLRQIHRKNSVKTSLDSTDKSRMGRIKILAVLFFAWNMMGCTLSPGFEALLQTIKEEPVSFKVITVDTTQLTLTEGSVAIVNVILDSKATTDTTVQLLPIGFTDRIEPLPLEITIPAGTLSAPLTIRTISDSTYQGSQFVSLNLLSFATDVRIDTANISLTIQDDDSPPTISIADDVRSEGQGVSALQSHSIK